MTQLELQKVSKFFGGLAAISRLDLQVQQGEIIGLIGPNGAGKTTTFNVITGELRPNEGEVIFEGQDITGLRPHQVATLGIVRTYQLVTLFPGYTALKNVLVGLHLGARIGFAEAILNSRSHQRKELHLYRQAQEILNFFNLQAVADEPAENLPHGLQRKLGVAIALAARPKMLLLDEPLTGMNPNEVLEMIATIRRIRDRNGITVVVVEHNMRAVMALCERIVVINFGVRIAEGAPQDIQANKQVVEAYLGSDSHAA
ncbi:MAG: ABC transporter ATP-binding protein [Desulfobacterales bacterium]|nr:MAG: ABC transporter ATP-binding protein [Desulfobacterales bacterium]